MAFLLIRSLDDPGIPVSEANMTKEEKADREQAQHDGMAKTIPLDDLVNPFV
jgi:hypothetical protein